MMKCDELTFSGRPSLNKLLTSVPLSAFYEKLIRFLIHSVHRVIFVRKRLIVGFTHFLKENSTNLIVKSRNDRILTVLLNSLLLLIFFHNPSLLFLSLLFPSFPRD